MYYKPGYQRRYGECKICHQGIVIGERIMIGTGYWHKHLVTIHDHYGCWLETIKTKAKEWFFANEFKRVGMTLEQRAKLNRLRAKRYYIQQKGGEPNETLIKVAEIEKQIAFVKAE